MLQSMRDGASSLLIKIVLFGFLTLAVLGLVLADIGGFFRGGTSSTTVAEIGRSKYDLRDFDRHLRAQTQRLNITIAEAFDLGLPGMLVQEQANLMVLRRELSRIGLRVDDQFVAQKANELVNSLLGGQTPDNIDRNALFLQLLRSMGVTEQQYIAEAKADIAEDLFLSPLNNLIRPYSALADQLYAQQMEQRTAQAIIVKPDQNLPAPSNEELLEFYRQNSELYRTKEYRSISIAQLKSDNVKSEIEVSDDLIERAYQERLTGYTQPETRRIAQAIIDDREIAFKIYEQTKTGDNLQTALRKVTGGTDNFLDPANYTEQELSAEIAPLVFAAQRGEVTEPVQTGLGWLMAEIQTITAPRVRPLAEVREDLVDFLREDRLTRALFDISNNFDDLVASGVSLQEAAEEAGLTVTQFENIDALGFGKGSNEKKLDSDFSSIASRLIQESFMLYAGEVSPAIENERGDIFFVAVDNIEDSYIPAFEDIKSQVQDDWIKRRDSTNSREKALDIVEKIRAGENAGTFRNIGTFQRQDKGSAQFSRAAISALFQLQSIGSVTNLPHGETDHIVIRLTDIAYPVRAENTDRARFAELRGDVMGAIEKDLRDILMREWQGNLKVRVNHNVIKRQYEDLLGE